MKINHGCGSIRPTNWINTDSSLNAFFQKIPVFGSLFCQIFSTRRYDSTNVVYFNLNRKWRYTSNSVDIVYASHLFEHLNLESADIFLKESYRVLKPNGVIRIVVPDLYALAKKYVLEFEDGKLENPSLDFMWAINMHKEGQYKNSSFLKSLFAWLQGFPHQHKYMYDKKSLYLLFKRYGFVDIRFYGYGESSLIKEIKDLEGDREHYLSVYIEALKP
jgi:predicted SAM-dependent methyltransferase